jgi:hypothetical protein
MTFLGQLNVIQLSQLKLDSTSTSCFYTIRTFRRRVVLLATCFVLVSYLAFFSTLKMEAAYSSEKSVDSRQITRPYIPQDRTLQNRVIFSHYFHVRRVSSTLLYLTTITILLEISDFKIFVP